MRRASIAVFAVLLAGLSLVDAGAAEVHSLVYINGRPTRVYFNDGDSFRQLNGPYTGRGSRLGGFNTLESFGPAHAWGTWHPYELWINAKLATYNGRRGIWHCTTDGGTDTYGRVLLDCPDLAIDQIRRGYAHAMNIDDTPARPEYLRAQQEAIAARRGMWAHGVPSFVLTSLHSRDEDPTKDQHKNRMVSVRDGHSEPWIHDDRYDECEWVCANEIVADEAAVRDFARALRADPEVAPALADTSNLLLIELVDRYARLGTVPEYTTPEVRALVEPRLEVAKLQGRLGQATERIGACAIYVDFRRRYGLSRAVCMRGRGEIPPQLRALRGLE